MASEKYSQITEELFFLTLAGGVFLGVVRGKFGSGAVGKWDGEWFLRAPDALRAIAKVLRRAPSQDAAYLDTHRALHKSLEADASILIVLDGHTGTGISVLGDARTVATIPGLLELAADNHLDDFELVVKSL